MIATTLFPCAGSNEAEGLSFLTALVRGLTLVPSPEADHNHNMLREFASREELLAFMQAQFLSAASCDSAESPSPRFRSIYQTLE